MSTPDQPSFFISVHTLLSCVPLEAPNSTHHLLFVPTRRKISAMIPSSPARLVTFALKSSSAGFIDKNILDTDPKKADSSKAKLVDADITRHQEVKVAR